jgi:DNA-binding MarR family transcriptional regulator
MHRSGESQGFYVDLIAGKLDCGKSTVRRMLQKCVKAGWIGERGDQQFRRYEVTEKGREGAEDRPSVLDWVS